PPHSLSALSDAAAGSQARPGGSCAVLPTKSSLRGFVSGANDAQCRASLSMPSLARALGSLPHEGEGPGMGACPLPHEGEGLGMGAGVRVYPPVPPPPAPGPAPNPAGHG